MTALCTNTPVDLMVVCLGGAWEAYGLSRCLGGLVKPAKAWVPGTAQGRRPCSSDLKLALPLLPAGAWEKGGGQLPTGGVTRQGYSPHSK